MESEKKRRKYSTSSNDSDTTDSQVTTWSRSSKNTGTNSTWVRQDQKKPSEVFRTDFITAMKLPDSAQLNPEEFYVLSDPWRQEWEKGVQVPANLDAIPEPVVRMLPEVSQIPFFSPTQSREQKELRLDSEILTDSMSRYDLDDFDVAWLELVNAEFRELALPELDELTMEQVLVELESQCDENMQKAIETEEGLGIEYDEDVVCDVCRSPEGEDGNEMVFCDQCNICVHQACYGILKVPIGNWLCRTCALGVQPKCLLCPKRGGALKPTRSGTKWIHVSCALWIPEVSFGCPEKMEPITKVSHIPASRWALSCSLCREHTGTCIQCSMPSCIVAFHVTCAFDHGLEMHTILAENDEVRFKSYCLEHSNVSHIDRPESRHTSEGERAMLQSDRLDRDQTEPEKVSKRKQKLQELEDEFYQLVNPKNVADSLGLPDIHVDFLYQFWKLRRRANFNRPVVTLKRDEVDNLAQQEQDVLYRRLKLFTHLRQDLERVRNLCYMVTRREKMKHNLCNLQEKIFNLTIELLEEDLAGEETVKAEKGCPNGIKDRGKEQRKSSSENKEKLKSKESSLVRQIGFSLPLDDSLFDSWLAQSVQITADNMLSHWALGGEPHDSSASLLSDQLLQGEESLINLMMDHSMKSTWKTPQLGRKGKARNRGPKQITSGIEVGMGPAPKGKSHIKYQGAHDGRRGERLRSSKAHHHHHHFYHLNDSQSSSTEGKIELLQPPISKMDSCHISEKHEPSEASAGAGVMSTPETESRRSSREALRVRLPRQGKSRFKSGGTQATEVSVQESIGKKGTSLLDTETDGYFSDAEHSDSSSRAARRKLHLTPLHTGNEEVLWQSVLAS
ncbi:protein Jade-1 isoform X2 [Electrophorus electricus]|nr:protein Jade-1 isoform X2 [Electrophorus electricus]XP_026864143.2 protein Jade-1 isoform X2 [Electrophorus electricus]XP_026864144.2 protein Jade-1 isoform X2 [Electrophorus electricus]XP_026864145.2 protein Jade-1 isoform X2 [Electrophorus electricus]XP_026864146.2 protein Jade-1 isoform X2 [Electrophorus electricus]XP_026864148.2 protein Jade-1 isoform X2 [Electrophorus electricus]XP_026864149.2 protein Jade-1 isoform X2 [Electrophorus electricus]XP_035383093.1 protein Jade-1 isoform X